MQNKKTNFLNNSKAIKWVLNDYNYITLSNKETRYCFYLYISKNLVTAEDTRSWLGST